MKNIELDNNNNEVISLAINLINEIYSKNSNILAIYVNYFYKQEDKIIPIIRIMLVSKEYLSRKELCRFNRLIYDIIKLTGFKIEIYNHLDYNYKEAIREYYELKRDLISGDIAYDTKNKYINLKNNILENDIYLTPYQYNLEIKPSIKVKLKK